MCTTPRNVKPRRRLKLRWRVSRGARRSLGWVPFKAASLKRKGVCLRFAGKSFRVFERERLEEVKWQGGCFAQDAVGDWWLCLPVKVRRKRPWHRGGRRDRSGVEGYCHHERRGTAGGRPLDPGYAEKLATAQRRGHKRQAKRIHRKAARCRADALHKFSRKMVDQVSEHRRGRCE